MIPVTKPFLPPLGEYQEYLQGIWQRQWLTNMGPLASELEMAMKEHLQLNHLLFVTNGTVALQMALKALDITGEVITTPFSFVATTSSLVWEGCKPVFVDIDPESLNIDASRIEAAITPATTAILATHVYGNPCDVERIEQIARAHNLKVIYDGAHAFGVQVAGRSLFSYGDISTCSLHATKLFHSGEGGFVACTEPALLKRLASIRNFGIESLSSFDGLGINGKNSEFHAAMGLCNLKHIADIHAARERITRRYDEKLQHFRAKKPVWHSQSAPNYSYYPIVMESEDALLRTKAVLDTNEIFTRRYFYPSLASTLPYLPKQHLEITEDIARRVLCLPLYYELSLPEIDLICRLMLRVQNSTV